MTLGEKIRYLRKKNKLSQKKLAELIDIHENHLGRYENDLSVPTSPVVKKFCEIFKVPADYLLFEESELNISGNISDKELLTQFQKIEAFGDDDKKVIKTLIDAFIAKHEMRKLVMNKEHRA